MIQVCYFGFLFAKLLGDTLHAYTVAEPTVRTELMDQIPHIAMYCQEYSEQFDNPISSYILPIIVKYLMDNNHQVCMSKYKNMIYTISQINLFTIKLADPFCCQVRKTSQAAMLVLLDQELINKGKYVMTKLCCR